MRIDLQLLINFDTDDISESDYNLSGSSVSICKPELSLLSDSALKSMLNNIEKTAELLSQLLLNNVCRCDEIEHQRVHN